MRNIIGLAAGAVVLAMSASEGWAQPSETAPAIEPAPGSAPQAPELPAATAMTDTPAATLAESVPTGPSVSYVTREQPPVFMIMTAGKAAFAVIGSLAMIAESEKLVKDYRLEDPANDMAGELSAAFAASKQGHVTPPVALPADKKGIQAAVTEVSARNDYFVFVNPTFINVAYFSFDWMHYGLQMSTQVQVFDKSGKPIAKAKCQVKDKKVPDSPTKEELLADDAQRLRAMIDEAAANCLVQLKSGLKL